MASPPGPMISSKPFKMLKIPSSLSSNFINLSPFNLSSTVKVYTNCLNNFWSEMPDHTFRFFGFGQQQSCNASHTQYIRNSCVDNRKSLTYNHWFKESPKPLIPSYYKNTNLSFEDVKSIARFRHGSHYLEIEQGRSSN
jgi:hypothetical protein